jgi:hypothetical protein
MLRPGGWFAAVWNTRLIEANPLLAEIEEEITRLKPDVKRVSFGPSGFTEDLTERLVAHPGFEDVVTIEGRHTTVQTADRYMGAWRSVNDVRSRLGEEAFTRFLERAERRLAGVETVEVTYLSRMWAAKLDGGGQEGP